MTVSEVSLLKEQNKLLREQLVKLDAQSTRDDLRRRAREWDARHPIGRLGFFKNPWEQYK